MLHNNAYNNRMFFFLSFLYVFLIRFKIALNLNFYLQIVFAQRLALIRQQRAEAAKKREEEKAGNDLIIVIVFSKVRK